jgi:hypothetical protein
MRFQLLCFLTAAVCFLLAGCGAKDLSPVGGVVTLDGKPLPSGNITFQAVGKASGTASIQPDGRYVLKTGGENGLTPGDYKVAVSAYRKTQSADPTSPPVPVLITPKKYNLPETSGLTARILSGKNECNFDLTTK